MLQAGCIFVGGLQPAHASAAEEEIDASDEAGCPPGWYCTRSEEASASGDEPPLPLPPPPRSRYFSQLGSGLRLAWVPLPREASAEALLWGAGVFARIRPVRGAALELGVGYFGGRDYLGRRRDEAHLESNLVLLSGRDDQFAPYGMLGLDLATGSVEGFDFAPWYLGGHLGLGAGTPRAARLGAGLELLGFFRGRIDRRAEADADYVDPHTGRSTNMSLGVLLRFTALASF